MPLSEFLLSDSLRLDFTLPMFSRAIWVDDRAREVWEPRLARIANSWREIEWRTVVDGVRPSALVWLSHDELVAIGPRLKRNQLCVVPVTSNLRALPGKSQNALVYRVLIGKRGAISDFRRAWNRANDDAMGGQLGYPVCCRAFFRKIVVEACWLDPTWPRAVNTIQSRDVGRSLDVLVPPELNLFWETVGVRLLPHVPCSYNCDAAETLGKAFIATGKRAGYKSELDHALEILRWPVEWSALHGIAEIKTPILKLSTRTDATPDKLIIRHQGDRYPLEGARGIRFPYAAPTARIPVKLTRQK